MNTLYTGAKLVLAFCSTFLSSFNFEITQLDTIPSKERVAALQSFESSFVYPFSETEEFTIKHGLNGDYSAFFKQLGKTYYYVVTAKTDRAVKKIVNEKEVIIQQKAGEIAAAVAVILRTVTMKSGKQKKAWYICDLKVNKNYQGEHLPLLLMQRIATGRFMQCSRGYGICMNPPSGEPKAAAIVKKHGPISGLDTQVLNLYTLSAEQVQEARLLLEQSLRTHGYLKPSEQLILVSTSGKKDYEISDKRSGESHFWQLLHMQAGATGLDPLKGATHMICAVNGTQLDNDFRDIIGAPSSTAQIVSYGMKDFDFNHLTSNQI